MAISEVHAGRSYPPTAPYEVSAAKIAEFATALGDDSPRYRGEDPIAPPTFVAVISSPAWELMFDDPELELTLPGSCTATSGSATSARCGPGMWSPAPSPSTRSGSAAPCEIISASVEITRVGGEPVCTAQATFLHSAGRGRMSATRLERLEVGTALPPLTVRFTRERLVRYAGASTDFNPIHYSDHFAAQIGLPGVIAHGMLTMGTALRVVTDWVGDQGTVRSYFVRFTKPVVVPDDDAGAEVTFSATSRRSTGRR